MALLAWVLWVSGNQLIFEPWVPEPINFEMKKAEQFTYFLIKQTKNLTYNLKMCKIQNQGRLRQNFETYPLKFPTEPLRKYINTTKNTATFSLSQLMLLVKIVLQAKVKRYLGQNLNKRKYFWNAYKIKIWFNYF